MREWDLAQQAVAEGAAGEQEPHVPEGLASLVWGYQDATWGAWGRGPLRSEAPPFLQAWGALSGSEPGRDLGPEYRSVHVAL